MMIAVPQFVTRVLPRFAIPCALLLSAGTAGAQGVQWNREAELSASIFFGNTSQRLGATRASVARADSTLEISLGARFTYADAEDDAGVRAVNRRSWDATGSFDLHPFSTLSPFVFGSLESSLEKQIDLRYGAGAGAKLTFVRDSLREHSFSLAVLAEKTTPRVEVADFDDDLLTRWSARHRLRLRLTQGLNITSITFYRPRLDDLADYTISSVNSLGLVLSTRLSFTFTFIDNYDSEARVRGAASNNDGSLLFGLKAVW